MNCPKRSKSKPVTFNPNPLKGKTPEEERVPQVLDDLNDASDGSEVMYFAWADLPEEFLRAIVAEDDTNIPNRTLAARLGATKNGQASSSDRFMNKMKRLQSVIPFATIRYIAIIIPPTARFTAKQSEQSTHLLNIDYWVLGEWFNLTAVQREDTVARYLSNGCSVYRGQTSSPRLNLNGTVPGTRGKIYFARFDWGIFLPIINTLQQNVTHQSTCMKMLSVKIGSGKVIIRGDDVDSDDDDDDDDAGTFRGSQFITFTSHLARTSVKAFECDQMLQKERELHNQNNNNNKWAESGEWFHLDDDEVDEQIPQNKIVIETKWERRRDGRRREYDKEEVIAWIRSGIFPLGAVDEARQKGLITE